ncbi:MAG: 2-(1,2-epoxy-1,2-dihydrophenyl)acetyl-CoA isomerase [Paracoccaceae bacterium]|jgi:2-(1,2-epoxy-1,2-dihydrophenyl)acetyl-CoA isomerase
MTPPRYRTLHWSVDDGAVVTIALARPEARNALNAQMRSDLMHGLARAAEVGRAVLLTGAGDVFCAGQDLGEGRRLRDVDLGRTLRDEYIPLLEAMRDLPIPILAAVNGDAAGAGMQLALSCDVVIAADSARFVVSGAQLGLMPDAGATWWLPRLIGPARAMGMALFAEPISAARAADWGLIWEATSDAALLDHVHARATTLARGPSRAYAETRRAMRAAMGAPLDAHLLAEADTQAELGRSRDFLEAMVAMAERRDPSFEGR